MRVYIYMYVCIALMVFTIYSNTHWKMKNIALPGLLLLLIFYVFCVLDCLNFVHVFLKIWSDCQELMESFFNRVPEFDKIIILVFELRVLSTNNTTTPPPPAKMKYHNSYPFGRIHNDNIIFVVLFQTVWISYRYVVLMLLEITTTVNE